MTRRIEKVLPGEITDGQITLTTPEGSYVWFSTGAVQDAQNPLLGICLRFKEKGAAEDFLRQIKGKSLRVIVNDTPQRIKN